MTMNDGMANCSVINPFNVPISVPKMIATADAIQTEMDIFISIAATTETNVAAVPTEQIEFTGDHQNADAQCDDAKRRNRLQHHRDVRPRQISETGRSDQGRRDTDNLDDDENDQDACVGRAPETLKPMGETCCLASPPKARPGVWAGAGQRLPYHWAAKSRKLSDIGRRASLRTCSSSCRPCRCRRYSCPTDRGHSGSSAQVGPPRNSLANKAAGRPSQ